MKKLFLLFFLGLFVSAGQAQTVENFDGGWKAFQDQWKNGASSFTRSYDSTSKYEGAASMKIEWKIISEDYGGISFARYTDAMEPSLDISGYDSLVFYMKVERPATNNDTYLAIILRENPSDASYTADPTSNNFKTEMWRHQFNNIFTDNSKTWKRISVPLKVVGDPKAPTVDDWMKGWNRQGVGAGRVNNAAIDWNSIRGFYVEFDCDSLTTKDSAIVYIDNMMVVGHQVAPLVLFNGRFVTQGVQMTASGTSKVSIDANEDFANKLTGSVKWAGGTGLNDGVLWNFKTPRNIGPNWKNDTLQFAIKAPKGFGAINVTLTDLKSSTPAVYNLAEASAVTGGYDGAWHLVKIPMKNFSGGSWDSSNVAQFSIKAAGQSINNLVVWLDNIWAGNQTFKIDAPANPKNILAIANGKYINTITWDFDTTNQALEYNVYSSLSPITSVHGQGVALLKNGITSGGSKTGLLDNRLVTPVNDTKILTYYAVTANDFMYIESVPTLSSAVNNTAKGMVVINPKPPANFVADGNLTEWAAIPPIRLNPQDGSGHLAQNTIIQDSLDLNARAYLAMDKDNLYVAFNVTDDSVKTFEVDWPGYDYDSPELFIGLYDAVKSTHFANMRGAEPDYKLRFGPDMIFAWDGGSLWSYLDTGKVSYKFKVKALPAHGYTIEAKIPFKHLAEVGGDSLFTPVLYTKIPIDLQINDRDVDVALGYYNREGLLTYSLDNNDNEWGPPSVGTYTWIGAKLTDVHEENLVATSYSLSQNYPNPFNPVTQIKYNLAQSGKVTLKVYDILGREVTTLVNEIQNAGAYKVNFDAARFASGVYFYSIEAGSFRSVKKMMLLK